MKTKLFLCMVAIMLMIAAGGYADTSAAVGGRVLAIAPNISDGDCKFIVGSEGELIVSSISLTGDLTTKPGITLNVHKLVVLGSATATIPEVICRVDHWTDVAAKSSNVISGVAVTKTSAAFDSANLAVLSLSVTSYVINNFTQMVVTAPRDVNVHFDDAAVIFATCTLTGVDARGNVISTNVVVGGQTFAHLSSNFAFATLTTLAFSKIEGVPTASTIIICIGTGDKIGLLGDIDDAEDVYGYAVGGTYAAVSGCTISTVCDTITPATIADGSNDYHFFYRLNSE